MSGRFRIQMCQQPANSCTKWTDVTLVDEPTATVMAKMLLSSFSNEDDDDDDDDDTTSKGQLQSS